PSRLFFFLQSRGFHPDGASVFARSRSRNFWILPVEVFGSGQKTTVRGALKWARWSRQKAMISSAVAFAAGFRVTKAQGVSPHIGSGRATTAASSTEGWR